MTRCSIQYLCVCVRTCKYAHISMHTTYECVCVCVCVCVRARVCARVRVCVCVCVCVYLHKHVYICGPTQTCIYIQLQGVGGY